MKTMKKRKLIISTLIIAFTLALQTILPAFSSNTYTAWQVETETENPYGNYDILAESFKNFFYEVNSNGNPVSGGTDIPLIFDVDAFSSNYGSNLRYVPSKVVISVYVVNNNEYGYSEVSQLRDMFEFKSVDVDATSNGGSTTVEYNVGSSGSIPASVTWYTSWSTGSSGQPDRSEPASVHHSLGSYHWYQVRLVSWEYDFHEEKKWNNAGVSGALMLSIINSEAAQRLGDNFQIKFRFDIYFSQWARVFFWFKTVDRIHQVEYIELGDGLPSTDTYNTLTTACNSCGSSPIGPII